MAAALSGAANARPPLSGWLLKRKSSTSRSRVLRSSNRRFFTLEFDSQIFFYAHTEDKKTVSMPTHFRHIQGVERFAAAEADSVEDISEEELDAPVQRSSSKASVQSVGSKSSSLLRLSRLPSLAGFPKRSTEQNGFVVRMQDKSFELVCESKVEVDVWIAAIREALALAKNSLNENVAEEWLKAEPSTSPGSSRCTTPQSISSHGSLQALPPANRQPPPAVALASAMKMFAEADAAGAEKCHPATFIPSVPPASFPPTPRSVGATTGSVEVPLPPLRSARSTTSGEKRGPCQFAVTSVLKHRAGDTAFSCWNDAPEHRECHNHEQEVAARYSDKASGLSLNQRLSQLEFSDDEEDSFVDDADDPPLAHMRVRPAGGDSTKTKSRGAQCKSPAVPVVTVDACEAFVTPDSDDD